MYYQINGGKKLFGEVEIGGAKNCLLPLIASSVAIDGIAEIDKCPPMTDVLNMIELLRRLGAKVEYGENRLQIDSRTINYVQVDENLSKKLRGSVLLLGALLARFKRAVVPLSGGCAIGKRPIDIHISALKRLGVNVEEENGKLYCDATNSKGNYVRLTYPSVGASENLITFASLTKGTSVLDNVAMEPEVVSLEKFLVLAGAKISGVGSSRLEICGVEKLNSIFFSPIPDRIETATYLTACLMTQGKITLRNTCPLHVKCLVDLLPFDVVTCCDDCICVQTQRKIESFGKIVTGPYPMFATDMQSLVLSLSTVAMGQTLIFEKVFENRFSNCQELVKMGAKIDLFDDCATIFGIDQLCGADVKCSDLRSGAGLVLAGLNAKGTTRIFDVFHILRGYCDLAKNLNNLGAEIFEIKE